MPTGTGQWQRSPPHWHTDIPTRSEHRTDINDGVPRSQIDQSGLEVALTAVHLLPEEEGLVAVKGLHLGGIWQMHCPQRHACSYSASLERAHRSMARAA